MTGLSSTLTVDMHCHCVHFVRQDWNACAIVSLWEKTLTTTKRHGWNTRDTLWRRIPSQSGIKFAATRQESRGGYFHQNHTWMCLPNLQNLTLSIPMFCLISHPSVYHFWKKSTQFWPNWVHFTIYPNTPNLFNLGSFIADENPRSLYQNNFRIPYAP